MDIKTAGVRFLSLVLIFGLSQTARAGKLDADFIQTSPTKALVYAIAFPGGGHFYLSRKDPKYKKTGFFFLALGLGSGLFLGAELKKSGNSLLIPAALLAGGIKIWEFGSVTDAAETQRLQWFRENFKRIDAPGAAAPEVKK